MVSWLGPFRIIPIFVLIIFTWLAIVVVVSVVVIVVIAGRGWHVGIVFVIFATDRTRWLHADGVAVTSMRWLVHVVVAIRVAIWIALPERWTQVGWSVRIVFKRVSIKFEKKISIFKLNLKIYLLHSFCGCHCSVVALNRADRYLRICFDNFGCFCSLLNFPILSSSFYRFSNFFPFFLGQKMK